MLALWIILGFVGWIIVGSILTALAFRIMGNDDANSFWGTDKNGYPKEIAAPIAATILWFIPLVIVCGYVIGKIIILPSFSFHQKAIQWIIDRKMDKRKEETKPINICDVCRKEYIEKGTYR